VISSLYKVLFIIPRLFNISPDDCSQAVKGQVERDKMLVNLMKTMEDVYSFVEATDSFQRKVNLLEKTINKILKQTIECAIFIREYTGRGFGGDHRAFKCTVKVTNELTGRLLKQTFTNTEQKIADLFQTLVSLKRSLDSANIIQTGFISTRTLEGIEKLGAANVSIAPLSDMLTKLVSTQSTLKI
jgi:hypothetical protein